MAITISEVNALTTSSTFCHGLTITLFGIDNTELITSTEAIIGTAISSGTYASERSAWTDTEKNEVYMYSDGYQARVELTLAQAGTISSASTPMGDIDYNGMCFGVNAAVKGAYCLYFWGTVTDDLTEMGLMYLSADEWNGTTFPTPTVGVDLNETNFGATFTPGNGDTGGMADGEILTALWF